MYCITCIVDKVEASDGTEAFNLLVAAVNSADERVRLLLNPQKNNSKERFWFIDTIQFANERVRFSLNLPKE